MQTETERIIQLLYEGTTKGEILKLLGLGKIQDYADISSAQKLAKELYDRIQSNISTTIKEEHMPGCIPLFLPYTHFLTSN